MSTRNRNESNSLIWINGAFGAGKTQTAFELRGRVEVKHFALIASPQTLRRRLRTRLGYGIGRLAGHDETWAMQQIDRCTTALSDSRFDVHVATDDRSVNEVVEDIATRAGLELVKPRLAAPRYQLRRLSVGLRHIR